MTEISLFANAIGGGLGSIARFVISREMGFWLGNYLPYFDKMLKRFGFIREKSLLGVGIITY